MDEHEQLVTRVSEEQGDILGTIQLVEGDEALHELLFEQLVDLLVEGMFLDVRDEYLAGELDHDAYLASVSDLADKCREGGLLPLPSRHS
ncbi:hypothetical protein [Actinospongicola halichondriae]|uniref:hypothetical protein n=1 Tax=Actinospongicola halichondriae TaxID=3236844 RepID=UPI003D527EF8